jgi:gliding motility-associated lipoprotein GldH
MEANSSKQFGRKKISVQFLMIVSLLWLMPACSNDAFFEEFRKTDGETWHMNDLKEFPVYINDTAATYRLIFTIRNTTDYEYSNLYIFFTSIAPGQILTRDTIECLLADRYGRWLGKGFGKIRENRFLIKDNLFFPETGEYLFTLGQAMRSESLKGIADVGLRLEKTGSTQ